MNEFTHKFTESGLGKAPFKFLGIMENAFDCGDGTTKAGGCCDHCGTGIRYEFHIMSADGVKSKVGSDCIKKSDDSGLINIAKNEENKRRRAKNQEKREAERVARLDAQRAKNGGLTDYEVQEKQHADRLEAERVAKLPIIELLAPLADDMRDGQDGFRDSIAKTLENGDLPYGRGRSISLDILAKMVGRKNSKAYNAEYDRVETIYNNVEELIK